MRATLLIGSALAALAAPQISRAQALPADDRPVSTAVQEERETLADDVVVTGSRLRQTADTQPAPVLAVDNIRLEQSGTDNVARTLRQLGPVGVGRSDTNSQNFYAEAGLNLVDLRRLGFERTLVLVNGRRQVPGDIGSSAVDLNTIPAPLIERVEILTGGSSAVYGADAVSGVINVILRDRFDGLEARVRGGLTSRGDGEQYGLTLTGGRNFSEGRGNVALNLFYDKVEGVRAIDRNYASDNLGTIDNPAIYLQGQEAGPDVPFVIHTKPISFFGPNQRGIVNFFPFGVDAAFTVLPGGTGVRPYDFGPLGTDLFGIMIGGDGATFQQYDNLSLPTERYGGALNARYDVGNGAELFFEGRVVETRVQTRWQPAADFEYGAVAINVNNPFVPADLRAIVRPLSPVLPFERVYEDFGRRGSNSRRLTQQYTGGVEGDLGRFRYQFFGGYGRTRLESRLIGGRNQDRFLESIDVVLLNGQPACASAAARAAGCRPLNVFNPSATPDGIAYSYVEDDYAAQQTLWQAGGNVAGDLFDLPAGPVGAVLGVEGRRNITQTFPSAATRSCRVQLLCEEPSRGTVTVKEAFAELRVPLLKDLPLIRELTFQGAARVSDYNLSGTNWTWNAGGSYVPVEGVRLRGVRSRAVRAPNAAELFSPASQTFLNLADPCSANNIGQGGANRLANCRAAGVPTGFVATTGSKAVFFGGNRDLEPEKADTLTLGVTLTPGFLPGFRATVDYYDIKLKQAIRPTDPDTVLTGCFDAAVAPSGNPFCGAITRGADFQIASLRSVFLNAGRLETSGIDFGLDYTFGLSGVSASLPGRINLNVTGTFLDKLRVFQDANDPSTEEVRENHLPNPEWTVLASATYATDRFELTWRTQFYDSVEILTTELKQNPRPDNLFDLGYTGRKFFHDLSVAYDVTTNANLRVNVSNVFDTKPPRRGSSGFAIFQGRDRGGIYPNLGTVFSAVLTYKY